MTTRPKILIVDDEKPLRDTLARWFRSRYDCVLAPDAEEAMKAVAANPDLALMISDVRMPGEDGVALLKKAKAANPDMGVILLTAYGTVDLAVEAMKDGADDFFQKPITDLKAFELRVEKAMRNAALAQGAATAGADAAATGGLAEFTGDSPAMEKVYRLIRKVAPTDATVIIEGPSGTGKELAARAIHALSRRAGGPFVAVECSALSKDLLESELFGYEPGAFTGASEKGRVGHVESAAGGTLFLDEIGEIDLATQVKLLRVLESRTIKRVGGTVDIPVDFRLVAATNRNLAQMVAEGKFREDLYYRLNVVKILIPPLRERTSDIPILVRGFLSQIAAENGKENMTISEPAMAALSAARWPGNIRELRNCVENMVVLCRTGEIGLENVPVNIRESSSPGITRDILAAPSCDLEKNERILIERALNECGGNRSRAAEKLGISRRTLHRKLKLYNIE